jgi:hypothetical protein
MNELSLRIDRAECHRTLIGTNTGPELRALADWSGWTMTEPNFLEEPLDFPFVLGGPSSSAMVREQP